MKGTKKYIILAGVIAALLYDVVVLLIRKNYDSTSFWITFGFTNFSFVALLIAVLLTGPKTGERGIQPITTILGAFCITTVLLSFIMYALTKYIDKLDRFAVWATLPFIFVIGIFAIIFAFALMNGHVIRSQSAPKPMMFSETDVTSVLTEIEQLATDATIKTQVNGLINLAKAALPSEDNEIKRLDQSIREYVQFLYKNVTRNEMDNVYNNIKKINALYKERSKNQ